MTPRPPALDRIAVLAALCLVASCSGSSADVFNSSVSTSGPRGSVETSEPVPGGTASAGGVTGGDDASREMFGPGDFVLPDPVQGLSGLGSYRAELTVSTEGTVDGEHHEWSITTTMSRTADPAAAILTIQNTGDAPDDVDFVAEIDGLTYRRDPAGDCIIESSHVGFPSLADVEPATRLGGVIGAQLIGPQTIDGIDTTGYSFDERAVGQAGIAATTGEVWVADDGGYVVDYTMTSTGGSELLGDGAEGSITWRYRLRHVNEQVAVVVPSDCTGGLAAAPMPPDATNVRRAPGWVGYDTAAPVADVLAFYRSAATDLGWAAGGEMVGAQGGSAEFEIGEVLVSIFVAATGDGSRVDVIAGMDQGGAGGGSATGGGAAVGTATIELTGGREVESTWEFAPQFSFFGGFWTMTFHDPSNPMPDGPFLTMVLDPARPNLSYSDGMVTIVDAAGACTLQLDRQAADGASGRLSCTGVQAFGAQGPVDLTVAFDATV